MNDTNKELIRTFYRQLATPEERDLYFKILNMKKQDRSAYLCGAMFRAYQMDEGTYSAIMECAEMSKDELIAEAVAEAAQEARKGILATLKYFFSLEWLG